MPGLNFLKTVDIFKGLTDDQLQQLMAGGHQKEYQHGKRLVAEGEDADRIWIVTAGQVDLRFDLPGRSSTEENTVFSITTGNTLGWSSFVPPFKYKLSAYCATRSCQVLQIKKEYLLRLFEQDTRMGYRVISNLAGVASIHFHRLQNSLASSRPALIKVAVHMATCGIAAGARQVMTALMDEISQADRPDIRVATYGCIGRCETEPNVTVEISGEEPVVYQKMTPQKMRQVFNRHILGGKVQQDYVLTE
jgi:(2Fe-2S) ferredoxin/signal-transduction protein with cAMP-binding, CBS, and nucleotidyltransferase domain